MSIVLFRHGECLETDPRSLTDRGIAEVAQIADKAGGTLDIGYSNERLASLQTTALMLGKPIEATNYVTILDGLGYQQSLSDTYNKALERAFISGRNLRFLVDQSNEFQSVTYESIVSRSTLSATMARYILNNSVQLIDEAKIGYCTREFVAPCFVYSVLEASGGNADEYITHYEENLENSPRGRLYVVRVNNHDKKSLDLEISDDNGVNFTLSRNTLGAIIDEHETLLQQKPSMAAYLIPRTPDGKLVVLRYKDGGIYFIGGRINPDETVEEGLERESIEEVGISLSDRQLARITPEYTFIDKNGKHIVQRFYIMNLDNINSINFLECGAKIEFMYTTEVWRNLPFEKSRAFFARNILPLLDDKSR